jgi:TetR/AcrR family transcriptional regulator
MRRLPTSITTKVMSLAPLFFERGLDGVSINDIAATSGIPRATLYYHFDGKQGVFAYMCSVLFDDFEAAVTTAVASQGNAAERLSRVIRAQIDVYDANPMALQAVQPDLARAGHSPEMLRRAEQAYVLPVARLLTEGAADGSLHQVRQPRVLAAAILGAVTIAAQQTLPSTDPEAATELHETMLSMFRLGAGANQVLRPPLTPMI